MAKSLVVYVDVDDTLVRSFSSKRIPIAAAISLVRDLQAKGATLYCWSTAGAAYAKATAEEFGIAEGFAGFLPKPNLMLDDMAIGDWKLTCLHPNECRSLDVDELLSRFQ